MYVLGDDTNGLDGEALNAFGGNLVPLPLPPTHTHYTSPLPFSSYGQTRPASFLFL